MSGYTDEHLADLAGVALDRVRWFIDLGILEPEPGGFRPPHVQLVRIFESLEDAGISLEDLAKLMAEGHWSNAWADMIFPNPTPYSDTTLAEIVDDLGLPRRFVERLYAAWQLPRPGWDDRIREDEARYLRTATMVYRGIGDNEEGTLDNLRRIAETQAHFFREHVEDPLYASGIRMRDGIQIVAATGRQFIDATVDVLSMLYTQHLEHYTFEDIVQNLELALEQSGLGQRRPKDPPAIAFLDLSGYTSLTEREGDRAATDLAAALAEAVDEAAARSLGRVVKLLGDGAMFHFRDPRDAITCGLDLVGEVPARGLPPARVGVNAGPVVFRDADYFGRTVNVAARVTDHAGPGEVLVTADVAERGAPDGVRLSDVGEVALKGLSAPVRLFRAHR